jgi:hypothetical protein
MLIELKALNGRSVLGKRRIESLLEF